MQTNIDLPNEQASICELRDSDVREPNKPSSTTAGQGAENAQLHTGRMSNRLEELYKLASVKREESHLEEMKAGEKRTVEKPNQNKLNLDESDHLEDIATTDKRVHAAKANSSKRNSLM